MGVQGEVTNSGAGESLGDGNVDFGGLDAFESGEQDFGELAAGSEGAESSPAAKESPQTPPAAEGTKEGEAAASPQSTDAHSQPPPVSQEKKETQAPATASPTEPKPKESVPAQTLDDNSQASELDKFLSDVSQNEDAFVGHLADSIFKLTPETVQALADGQGETVVPRIVAKGALWAMKSTMTAMQKTLPSIISREVARITQQQKQRETAENAFFAKWPQLTREKHFSDIQQISHALRAANPSITFDDLVALTGASVMAKHGIITQQVNPAAQTSKGQTPPGFVPAAGGRVVGTMPLDENPFAGMSKDYDD